MPRRLHCALEVVRARTWHEEGRFLRRVFAAFSIFSYSRQVIPSLKESVDSSCGLSLKQGKETTTCPLIAVALFSVLSITQTVHQIPSWPLQMLQAVHSRRTNSTAWKIQNQRKTRTNTPLSTVSIIFVNVNQTLVWWKFRPRKRMFSSPFPPPCRHPRGASAPTPPPQIPPPPSISIKKPTPPPPARTPPPFPLPQTPQKIKEYPKRPPSQFSIPLGCRFSQQLMWSMWWFG